MSTFTEEEAKKHWCPESRVQSPDGMGAYNRMASAGGHASFGSLCMASQCMAWRWWGYHDFNGNFQPYQMSDGAPPEGSSAVWLRVGYCGKAGRP